MTIDVRLTRYATLAAAVDMLVEKRFALLNPAKWDDTKGRGAHAALKPLSLGHVLS